MAVESVSPTTPMTAAEPVVIHPVFVLFGVDSYRVAWSTPTHAPPGNLPIYFATQRFVI